MVQKKRKIPRPVHFETTVPVIRQCRWCAVWFAAGVAEGLKAEIDLGVALDQAQRLWCVLNRIEMYALRRTGLIQMDSMRLTDPRWHALFPQHYCNIKWTYPVPLTIQSLPRDDSIPF